MLVPLKPCRSELCTAVMVAPKCADAPTTASRGLPGRWRGRNCAGARNAVEDFRGGEGSSAGVFRGGRGARRVFCGARGEGGEPGGDFRTGISGIRRRGAHGEDSREGREARPRSAEPGTPGEAERGRRTACQWHGRCEHTPRGGHVTRDATDSRVLPVGECLVDSQRI